MGNTVSVSHCEEAVVRDDGHSPWPGTTRTLPHSSFRARRRVLIVYYFAVQAHTVTEQVEEISDPNAAAVKEEMEAVEEETSVVEAPVEEQRQIVVDTAPIDPRFPATNQARHCFVKYNEAHKCFADRGEDDDACKRLARDYRAICPVEWLEKWNEAREEGTWWGKW